MKWLQIAALGIALIMMMAGGYILFSGDAALGAVILGLSSIVAASAAAMGAVQKKKGAGDAR